MRESLGPSAVLYSQICDLIHLNNYYDLDACIHTYIHTVII